MDKQTHRTQIRMTDELYEMLAQAAKTNKRSINAEMTDRLHRSFAPHDNTAAQLAQLQQAVDAIRADIAALAKADSKAV